MDEVYPLPLTHSEEAGDKPVRIVRAAVRIALLVRFPDELRCLFVRHPLKGLELPGGAIEAGETSPQAALRELSEEAGVRLPVDHSLTLMTLLPLVDHRGGNWIDALHVTVATPEQLNFQPGAEFPTFWLGAKEIPGQVDQRLSSYQAALMALDAIL